ncbi:MAG: IPT/TIG domain-containing protein [Pyrinomonadaceae bacterium]
MAGADDSAEDDVFRPDPPEKVKTYQVTLLFTYHVLLAIFLAYAIYNVWPPQPWPGDTAEVKAEAKAEAKAEVRAEQARAAAQTVTPPNQNSSNPGSPTLANANSRNTSNSNVATNTNTALATASNTNAPASAPARNANVAEAAGSPTALNTAKPSAAVYGGERPPPFWLFGQKFQPTLEVRLLLLVLLAGAIGSYVHASSSLVDYLGNRTLISSWVWWYLLRPFIGMMLALLFYFVFRGGFITAGVNQGGEAAASFINPFGIAALAGLVGMFSKVAADKLNEVFLTLFAPKAGQGDAKRADKLIASIAPGVSAVSPNSGPSTGGTPVTISGTDFLDGSAVTFGGSAASAVIFKDPTMLTATTPAHAPGTVDVEVINPNKLKSLLSGGFTFVDGAGAEGGSEITAGAAIGENVETIDGCDVDIVDETPDEDLPITEGGVA